MCVSTSPCLGVNWKIELAIWKVVGVPGFRAREVASGKAYFTWTTEREAWGALPGPQLDFSSALSSDLRELTLLPLQCIVGPVLLSPQFLFKHVNAISFQTCQCSKTFLSLLSLGLRDIVFCAFYFSAHSSIMYWFLSSKFQRFESTWRVFLVWKCFPIYLPGSGHSQPCRSSGPKFLSVLNWLNGMPVSLLRI